MQSDLNKSYKYSECKENLDSDVLPVGLVFDLLGLLLVVGAAGLHLLGLHHQQFYLLLPVHQLFQRVRYDLFHVVQVLTQHDYLVVRSFVVELLF